jgi:hypothetical protein
MSSCEKLEENFIFFSSTVPEIVKSKEMFPSTCHRVSAGNYFLNVQVNTWAIFTFRGIQA